MPVSLPLLVERRLIGVCGYARSGKDTVAGFLVSDHGYRRLAFADRLKQVAYDLNPHIVSEGDRLAELVDTLGWDAAKSVPEVRQVLQNLGESCRQRIGVNVWVDAVMTQVDVEPDRPTVITDVRHANEMAAIRERDGIVVRVVRPGVGPVNTHISETALDSLAPDITITNDSTLHDLRRRVPSLFI